jgi:cell division protein FtsI (penicillin-binding protein 3)
VVIVDEPGAGKYYGGDVAAPVFARVVGGALRLLAVAPDAAIGAPGEGDDQGSGMPTPSRRQVALR